MELYRQYLLERENTHLLEYDWGFATYRFEDAHVYLRDIYVVPDKRDMGLGVALMNEVAILAREAGLDIMVGSVDENDKNSERMHDVMKHLGFKEHMKVEDLTYYLKEI